MTEYIKKEDALAHPFANGHYDKANANRDFIRGHESYKEWLEDLPVADVRENVKGKWLHTGDGSYSHSGYYMCSECGARYETGGNYCSNCGAKMEVRDETD